MAASISESLRAGDLDSALAFATDAVRAAPGNGDARWLLAEVLLASGAVEKADRVLEAVAMEQPNPAVIEFRMLLRAHNARLQLEKDGRAPRYQGGDATPAQLVAMQARVQMRSGDAQAAIQAAEEVEASRPRVPGQHETAEGVTTAFEDIRDVDDMLACEFEVLTTAGDYMLVPTERVLSLSFDAPRRLRDLIWRRCAIEMKDGTEGVVFMPALYVERGSNVDNALRLGRTTSWTDGSDGPVRGQGQRMLLCGDEAVPLNAVGKLVFGS